MKAVVAAFNQEKALVGAFSVITNLRMELFEALGLVVHAPPAPDKLQPPRLHQLPHRVLHSLALLPPPAPEERGLNVDKSSLLINIYLCNYFMVGLLQANKCKPYNNSLHPQGEPGPHCQ